MRFALMLGLCVLITACSLAGPGGAEDGSRQSVIETARKYLIQGLVEHQPNQVPLAENAWRRELGRNTGSSGAEIKQRLLREEYRVITAISNERWLVEGEEAVVFYDLHVNGSNTPVLIAERFKVRDGLIEEIEALFYREFSGITQLSTLAIQQAFSNVRDEAAVQDSAGSSAVNNWYADGRFISRWSSTTYSGTDSGTGSGTNSGTVEGRWQAKDNRRCITISSGLPHNTGKETCNPVYRLGNSYISVNAEGNIHGIHRLSPLKQD